MKAQLPNVLIVDDEPDILELLELALSRMGLEVTRAGGVTEAAQRLAERSYALCLTDMRMADGSGLEVLRLIAERGLDLPVAVQVGGAVGDDLNHRVAVEPPGRTQRWRQLARCGHALVRDAVRAAQACVPIVGRKGGGACALLLRCIPVCQCAVSRHGQAHLLREPAHLPGPHAAAWPTGA